MLMQSNFNVIVRRLHIYDSFLEKFEGWIIANWSVKNDPLSNTLTDR